MERISATKLIRDTFEKPFDKGQFTTFSRNLVKHLDETGNFSYYGNYIPDAYEESIQGYDRIGKYEDEERHKLDVLTVHLQRQNSLEHARTMQRNFIAWYLKGARSLSE